MNEFYFSFFKDEEVKVLFSVLNAELLYEIKINEDESSKIFNECRDEIQLQLENGKKSGHVNTKYRLNEKDIILKIIWQEGAEKDQKHFHYEEYITFNREVEVTVKYSLYKEKADSPCKEEVDLPKYLRESIEDKIKNEGFLSGVDNFKSKDEIKYDICWSSKSE